MVLVTPFKPIALVVEDDALQRQDLTALLEESEIGVIQCARAEGARRVLDNMGGCIALMFTDVDLGGTIDGLELARFARTRFPAMHVIVTSGLPHTGLPEGATFLQKPWRALDVLREAGRSLAV